MLSIDIRQAVEWYMKYKEDKKIEEKVLPLRQKLIKLVALCINDLDSNNPIKVKIDEIHNTLNNVKVR